MVDLLNPKLVAENDLAKFYSNNLTETFNSTPKYAKLHLSLILAETKDFNERVYVLCKNGDEIAENTSYEAICQRADIIVLSSEK